MPAVAFDQFHPTHGDVCDGKRVVMADGTTATIAAVRDGWLVVHEGAEYGPAHSAWQVLHQLAQIQKNAECLDGLGSDVSKRNAQQFRSLKVMIGNVVQ
ncbi:hypothetical protein IPT12_15105 [Xanthomonas perforans]|uniref:Uncharacterized protein n=2 Tax=Xanthomonas TaxID=338 RepID=A0A6L9VTC5_XANPE|nr:MULTISPECIES: hypothetical protein [Xanthomonas]MBZ2413764.1 hypothetical protein [Xanthomonas perforans]MBZ2422158.1 hypothetical protein [Xanthomonas perforans]MBZ2426384.1 hypothetical protein [Xanthomonas perforans]MBZ2430840.1 hypothetical protein [Xanthomonas perforans]MBZ2448592.1 hypothetical protein [Xanthomonas perforans]